MHHAKYLDAVICYPVGDDEWRTGHDQFSSSGVTPLAPEFGEFQQPFRRLSDQESLALRRQRLVERNEVLQRLQVAQGRLGP